MAKAYTVLLRSVYGRGSGSMMLARQPTSSHRSYSATCSVKAKNVVVDDASGSVGGSTQGQYRLHHQQLLQGWEDPALAWASSYSVEARNCITPPPFHLVDSAHDDDDEDERYRSLEGYLKWRKWTTNTTTSEGSQSTIEEYDDESSLQMIDDYKLSMISHVMSTPLTLALHMEQYRRMNQNVVDTSTTKTAIATANDDTILRSPQQQESRIRLCCVGARAEATLPDLYWKELLILLLLSSSPSSASSLSISIDFIGPDIPPKMKERVVTCDEVSPASSSSVPTRHSRSTITLRGLYRGYFHDYFSAPVATSTANSNISIDNSRSHSAMDDYDFMVFFNPGFGHPNLRNNWDETLRLILHLHDNYYDDSDKCIRKKRPRRSDGRVLLLTAHSKVDAERDAKFLAEKFGIDHVMYNENPFASRIQYLDPFGNFDDGEKYDDDRTSDPHFIRPNHYMAIICI